MKPQYLVLFHAGDRLALELGTALSERVVPTSEVVFVESAALCSARWTHRVSTNAEESVVRLPNGQVLDSRRIAGGINRLQFVSGPQLASAADTKYAQAELHALLVSWIQSLPGRWLNPGSARGLSGAVRSWLEWSELARRADLAVAPYRICTPKLSRRCPLLDTILGPQQTVEVAGDCAIGAEPELGQRCKRLAVAGGYTLLALKFNTDLQLSAIATTPDHLNGRTIAAATEWVAGRKTE